MSRICLPTGRELPAGERLLHDLDARVLLERLLEPGVAIGVRRHAGDAAHLDHVALAAELLEQPGCAKAAVRDLIVRRIVSLWRRDALVDGHDLHAARCGLRDHRIQRTRTGRVDHDRVRAR